MDRKDYKAGMEAGAKPFEEKFKKQADAVERVGTRIESKLDDISAVQDVILQDLSAREKKELYDLNTVVDIGELEDTEKEFLVAVLFTLSNMTDCVSEHQQAYLRSVKTYLGIKNVQTEVDLAYIENIDSKRQTRAILQTVMEFLFLENCTHDYLDEYDDVLDYFDVKAVEMRKIEKNIDRIYNATGAVGLAEKYGFSPDEDPIYRDSTTISIESLQGFASCEDPLIYCWTNLSDIRDMDEMNYNDDDIHSRYEAERKAKSRFSAIHSQARDYFNTYSSRSLSRDASQKLFGLIKNEALTLSDVINNLGEEITNKNRSVIQELLRHLSLDTLKKNIEEVAEKELQDNYYQLSDTSSYLYLINYEEVENGDGGWSALFCPKSWWFDGMEAWMSLDKDIQDKAESYSKYVTKAFQREVLVPIISLIKRIDGVIIKDSK